MTPAQMKAWIDGASYQQLLSKWRFEPVGSPWFRDEIGDYYTAAMKRKREATPQAEQVAASKALGW
jgi:hypothetical protein